VVRTPVDGCDDHGVTAEAVAKWWGVAKAQDAHVSMCACCLSPCQIDSPVCKPCKDADLDALRRGAGGVQA
jgi:hypothetical protein